VLQCVAVCCSVVQCVAVCCSVLHYVAVCCRDSTDDRIAQGQCMSRQTQCNMLQHAATCYNTPHRTTLHHTAPHCTTLQHTATYCNTLQHTATYCNMLQHAITHCSTLQHAASQCSTQQHTAPHCITLQHTATNYNTPQQTAPCYSTLQHTATQCNTPDEGIAETVEHCLRRNARLCMMQREQKSPTYTQKSPTYTKQDKSPTITKKISLPPSDCPPVYDAVWSSVLQCSVVGCCKLQYVALEHGLRRYTHLCYCSVVQCCNMYIHVYIFIHTYIRYINIHKCLYIYI